MYCSNYECSNHCHRKELNRLCSDIIMKLVQAADLSLPKHVKKKRHKPMWRQLVQPEKDTALFWHSVWCSAGRPATGALADIRRRTRSLYHKAIRGLSKEEHKLRFQRMATSIYESENQTLWGEIKKIKLSVRGTATSIDGANDPKIIADTFKNKYNEIYNSNGASNDEMDQLEHDILNKIRGYSDSCTISVQQIMTALGDLNLHKSDGHAGLFSDNLIYGPHVLCVYLSLLYTAILYHGFLPDNLLTSVVVPIPKNVKGNMGSSDNYRGIALCSSITKLFDIVILKRFQSCLQSSNLQFAFKGSHSTTICASVFKDIVTYYRSRDTDVYCCFLDATKAFHLIKFEKLFQLLCKKDIPGPYLRILLDMYRSQKIYVKWDGTLSSKFSATNGIRQGAIISPLFFNLYIDVLLNRLKSKNVGCFIGNMFVGSLGYADDVTLLAPSIGGLQEMLKICDLFAHEFGVHFNTNKTVCMKMCRRCNNADQYVLTLDGKNLKWVKSVKYLGIHINYDLDDSKEFINKRGNVYTNLNNLLGNFRGIPSDILNVLFSHYCTSFYGSQAWDLRNKSIKYVCTAYNKGLRALWGLPFNSHTNIVLCLSKSKPLNVMLEIRFIKMLLCMYKSQNVLLKFVLDKCMDDVTSFIGSNLSYLKCKYCMGNRSPENICNELRLSLNSNCGFSAEEFLIADIVKKLICCRDGSTCISNIPLDKKVINEMVNWLTTK